MEGGKKSIEESNSHLLLINMGFSFSLSATPALRR